MKQFRHLLFSGSACARWLCIDRNRRSPAPDRRSSNSDSSVHYAVLGGVTLLGRSNVDTVFVAGKIRKWRGSLLVVDLNKLRFELEQSRDYIFEAAKVPRTLWEGVMRGPRLLPVEG